MLTDNILTLRRKFPELRSYFLENEDKLTPGLCQTLSSQRGEITLRYNIDGIKPLMIHSLYDPYREADRIISSYKNNIDESTHVFFYGIGFGYHIEEFIRLYPNISYSMYEPIPEVFLELTKQRDLKNIMNKNLKNLYIDRHNEVTNSYLEEIEITNKKVLIINLPSYQNIIPDKIKQFEGKIKGTISNRRSSLHTDASFQKLWVMNSLINFKTVLETPNILKDIDQNHFKNKPAIIVSAGPSLAEDIEHLRFIKENSLAYIFSVGSAINSLIEFDLLPDAVFTYDPSFKNKLVFEKMIEKQLDSIPIVFGSSVGYETIENYKGPKVHFITSQDRTSLYFLGRQMNLRDDLILDSPSIAVMTFQILNKIGFNPIVFSGQNLGYLDDRRYAEGIEYNHVESQLTEKELEETTVTKDVFGNEIKTSDSFNRMRESIESFASIYKNKTFLNSTKGGAEINNVPFKSIENVIEDMLTVPLVKLKWWENDNGYNYEDVHKKYIKLKKSMKDLMSILSSVEKVLYELSNNTRLHNIQGLQINLNKFDELYKQLQKNEYYKGFLSFYLRSQVKYVANEIKRLNSEPSLVKKGRELVPVFSRFIKQCRNENLELKTLIEKNIKKV